MPADSRIPVALSTRISQAPGYEEARDSISHDWIELLQSWGMDPYLITNMLTDPGAYLETIMPRLIILTGGDDPGSGDRRDQTEKAILEYAAANDLSVLGVCRGLQAINLHFGGRLDSVSGHVAVKHVVNLTGHFSRLYGEQATVNSFHAASISEKCLAPGLVAAGRDEDGNIEALHHASLPIAGIMWHPERPGAPVADRALFHHLLDKGAF